MIKSVTSLGANIMKKLNRFIGALLFIFTGWALALYYKVPFTEVKKIYKSAFNDLLPFGSGVK